MMKMNVFLCILLVVDVILLESTVNCDEGSFFLKAAKSIPRIGRRGKNTNEDLFEKFFLKASKSVPRIGRRDPPQTYQNEDYKYNENNIKYPVWSEISERFENNPELFTYPHLLEELEHAVGDDPSIYDIDKVRLTPTNFPKNKELMEYRLQPNNYM